MKLLLAVLVILAGCSQPERLLTPEQEAELKAKCSQGCVVIETEVWAEIVKRLNGVRS